jgi:Tol biopolymer transport system component
MTRTFFTAWMVCFALAIAGGAVWLSPNNLGTTVNTTVDDAHPTVAPNGGYIIFESNRPGGSGAHDIWITDRSGTTWLSPVNLGTDVNTSSDEYAPTLSADGSKMYWTSNTAGGSFGGFDCWWCPMAGGDPGVRVNMGAGINTVYNDISPIFVDDGQTQMLYFGSDRPGTLGGYDIYVSAQAGGSWQTPQNVGSAVNSSSSEEPVWISPDGNTMVFSSNRVGGSYGGNDLWLTVKSGSTWGTPSNLGTPLNSAGDERGATFRCNGGSVGGFIWFGSSRGGGTGAYDLWTSIESNYVTVVPMSLGGIKANFH